MSEIEKLNMIAEWQEQHKQLIEDLDNSKKRIAELEAKIKHLTKHLEPQAMSALFEQVEEEVKQEQRIAELKEEQWSLRDERDAILAQNEQYEKCLIDFNENLTKAKVLLKEALDKIDCVEHSR